MSRSNSSPPERVREPCVIYARYSSHAQRDVSIEQQVADCEAYALQNGLEVVKVYADREAGLQIGRASCRERVFSTV